MQRRSNCYVLISKLLRAVKNHKNNIDSVDYKDFTAIRSVIKHMTKYSKMNDLVFLFD